MGLPESCLCSRSSGENGRMWLSKPLSVDSRFGSVFTISLNSRGAKTNRRAQRHRIRCMCPPAASWLIWSGARCLRASAYFGSTMAPMKSTAPVLLSRMAVTNGRLMSSVKGGS